MEKKLSIFTTLARNYFLLFQIYAIAYIFINSYINAWFSLNKNTFFEFEKIIVINFFQAEILFLYLFIQKIKKSNKYEKFKAIYKKYIIDMNQQGIKKNTATVMICIIISILFFIFSLLIIKTPFLNFIKLVIGLNEIILKEIKLWIPCLFFLISFYFEIKSYSQQNYITILNKLKIILRSFLMAIPIFIILFLIRYYFIKNIEGTIISSGLLSINLSILITLVIFRIKTKNDDN